MPGDVAVHQPCAGVVSWEGDCEPAAGRQDCNIAACRILESKRGDGINLVEDANTGAENVEVMTVKMDGMRDGNWGASSFLDDPVRPLQ